MIAPRYCGTCGADLSAAPSGRFCPRCGAAREQPSIDRFEVRAVLGRGAAGTLFRAFDPALGRLVALRQLSRNITDDPDRFLRLQRSAALIAGIADKYPAGGIDYMCMLDGNLRVDDETSDPEGTVRTVTTTNYAWTMGRWQQLGAATPGTPRNDRHGFINCGDFPKQ